MTSSSGLSSRPKMAFRTTNHARHVSIDLKRGSDPKSFGFWIAAMMVGRFTTALACSSDLESHARCPDAHREKVCYAYLIHGSVGAHSRIDTTIFLGVRAYRIVSDISSTASTTSTTVSLIDSKMISQAISLPSGRSNAAARLMTDACCLHLSQQNRLGLIAMPVCKNRTSHSGFSQTISESFSEGISTACTVSKFNDRMSMNTSRHHPPPSALSAKKKSRDLTGVTCRLRLHLPSKTQSSPPHHHR